MEGQASEQQFFTVTAAAEEPSDAIPDEWYEPEQLGDMSLQSRFVDPEFSATQWLRFFNKYTSTGWMKSTNRGTITRMHHGLRVIIALQTIQCCRNGFYYLPAVEGSERKVVNLNTKFLHDEVRKTVSYRHTPDLPPLEAIVDTEVGVIEGDCIEAAQWLKAQGLNPVVLNMANQSQPGGGFHTGSGAQEENLHRRSNYFQSLEDTDRINPVGGYRNYPMSEAGAIYSPNIVVFRASEAKGYAFLETPFLLSFIACAALRHPPLLYSKEKGYVMTPEAEEQMEVKVRTILAVAAVHGHDSLVLSAFGCGAFCCPPKHVAEVFQRTINSASFAGRFKKIIFAIFDDHNARKQHNPEGNVKPFVDVFGNKIAML